MACEVCEHCQGPVNPNNSVTIKEGFSYHKECHKCYVCSETNLLDGEVFKGVLFCAACAQRIFQGCATARRAKLVKPRKIRSRSRIPRQRRRSKRSRMPINGVIELAKMTGSNTSTDKTVTVKEKSSKSISSQMALEGENNSFHKHKSAEKKNSAETGSIGTTTLATQEFLQKQNVPASIETRRIPIPPARLRRRRRNDIRRLHPQRKENCSDLRMAELGTSTEIASMALRNQSEISGGATTTSKVSRAKTLASTTLSTLNQVSESEHNTEEATTNTSLTNNFEKWRQVKMHRRRDERPLMDMRFGSILKLPYRTFKKNVLTRSSLISFLISVESDNKQTLLKKMLKQFLIEGSPKSKELGVKRLYSTINRRQIPYKMGWPELMAKASSSEGKDSTSLELYDSKHQSSQSKVRSSERSTSFGCKHYKKSYNYRCMRDQAMKLAGPTGSELRIIRKKITNVLAPKFVRKIIENNNKYAEILSRTYTTDNTYKQIGFSQDSNDV